MLIHGFKSREHPLYNTWWNIKQRCYIKTCPYYKNYGARGIKIYNEWYGDFGKFAKWVVDNLGNRPIGMTLDRKNNDGNYEPGNLKWSTGSKQLLNRRVPKNHRSGIPGLSLKGKKWKVVVWFLAKKYHISLFENRELAELVLVESRGKITNGFPIFLRGRFIK